MLFFRRIRWLKTKNFKRNVYNNLKTNTFHSFDERLWDFVLNFVFFFFFNYSTSFSFSLTHAHSSSSSSIQTTTEKYDNNYICSHNLHVVCVSVCRLNRIRLPSRKKQNYCWLETKRKLMPNKIPNSIRFDKYLFAWAHFFFLSLSFISIQAVAFLSRGATRGGESYLSYFIQPINYFCFFSNLHRAISNSKVFFLLPVFSDRWHFIECVPPYSVASFTPHKRFTLVLPIRFVQWRTQ